jgi:phosphoribosylglycinamide formyltransferase-1
MSLDKTTGVEPTRFVVLVSGNGTNLQALIDAIERGEVKASIVLVLSSDPEAYALKRAERAGIPEIALPYMRDPGLDTTASRRLYDELLAETVARCHPDFIFLLGWMRILGGGFIDRFPGKIVNLHPALPGAFPGTHAIERAWEAFGKGKIAETGVMIHFIPDERVDAGPVITSEPVAIVSGENFEAFEKRVHEVEHRLVVKTAKRLASSARLPGHKEKGA